MKRVGNLYNKMLNKKLITAVILNGSIGKKKRQDVKTVLEDVEGYTDKIYALLESGTYVPTLPKIKVIHDTSSGKEREINIVPYFPDGIIHQLATEVMKPVLMRGMYAHSCASIPKRGNMHAIKYMKKHLRNDRKGTKYCAKMDICHYYQNISIDLLMAKLERKMKDTKFLNLVRTIIESNPKEGLSIGFYINQWLANFFLEDTDRFICGLDGVKYYIRNMDDLVLMGANKKKLHLAVRMVMEYLESEGLEVKGNWQVFKVDSRGIDFVGYRFFHDYALLRRRNFLKLTRQCRKVKKRIEGRQTIPFRTAAGLLSRIGQLKHCNGTRIRQKHYDVICHRITKKLKDVVREYGRNQNHIASLVVNL